MGTLDLLRVGRKSKKNFINKSHDVNTTSDFGFCQPILFDTVLPGSNVSLKTKQFVRLAPLPTPTFGRVKVHTDTSFIKIKDVFPAFDNLMDQMVVNNPNVVGGYIPQGHNYIFKGDLMQTLLAMSFYYAKQGEYDKVPFRLDVHFNGPLTVAECDRDGDTPVTPPRTYPWRSVLNDAHQNSLSFFETIGYLQNGYNTLVHLFGTPDGSTSGVFYNTLAHMYSRSHYSFLNFNPSTGSFVEGSTASMPDIGLFLTYLSERSHTIYDGNVTDANIWSVPYQVDNTSLGSIYAHQGQNMTKDIIKEIYEKYPNIFSEPITVENADYLYVVNNADYGDGKYNIFDFTNFDSFTQYSLDWKSDYRYIVCLKLTPFGRRLVKILNGIYHTDCLSKNIPNYAMNPEDWIVSQHDVISVTPLFAYYKHWFDIYNPNREKNWLDTNCYRLIHSFYDYPRPLASWLFDYDDTSVDPESVYYYERTAGNLIPLRKSWFDFFIELGNCVYVLPVDNISVATPSPTQSVQTDISNVQFPYFSNQPSEDLPNPLVESINAGLSENYPYGAWVDGQSDRASGLGVQLALRLYAWTNKNSVIAKNCRAYLKRYNIELPRENILDRSSYYTQIDDVFSTAETSDGFLGEFAGKGLGSGICQCSLKDTKEYGYLVQTLCVAPHSGYVQANALFPITRMEHYQDMFDSLGMEAMSMRQVQARDYILSEPSSSKLFGFRPRYFDLKVKNNLANGYFAQRGTQAQYLPYSLDRIFGVKDIDSSVSTLTYTQNYYPLANEDIRKVGLVEQLGEYDRIFVDNTGMTDNFIFDILQEYKVWSPVKPVSDSFDTFDKETDDDTFNVEHS